MEYMDLLRPTAPSLVFARETCTPYNSRLLLGLLAAAYVTVARGGARPDHVGGYNVTW